MGTPPAVTVTIALAVFFVVFFSGTALTGLDSDAALDSYRKQLLQKLPQAKTAWEAAKERRRAEAAAAREPDPVIQADPFYAEQSRVVTHGELPGPGTFEIEVVGESHYQRQLEEICGGRFEDSARVNATAVLILDDGNPYDSKAVRVEINGYVVGHLNRENAREYRKKLKEAGHPRITAQCRALIVGGWDRGNGDCGYFGVRLDLPTKDD